MCVFFFLCAHIDTVFNDVDLVYLRKVNIKSDILATFTYIIQTATYRYLPIQSATLVSSARCWIFII